MHNCCNITCTCSEKKWLWAKKVITISGQNILRTVLELTTPPSGNSGSPLEKKEKKETIRCRSIAKDK
jgi:hypothetical protein